jgi:hypothetical protein
MNPVCSNLAVVRSMAPRAGLLALLGVLALAGNACGKRGDPLPPLRRAPQPVTQLSVAQRGQAVELRFAAPRTFTDGIRLPVLEVEILRADREGDLQKVSSSRVKTVAPGEILVETEALPAPGTVLRYAVRARVKRQVSVLATAPSLTVVAPPPSPSALRVAPGPIGVVLTWTPPTFAATALAPSFRVYRRAPDGPYSAPLIAAPTLDARFEDSTAVLGQRYCYVVRTVAALEPLVESLASEEACLDVRDVTAPAAPEGVAVFAQDGALEVSWSPVSESDLAGYRVYRQRADGNRDRLAELPASETRWRDASGAGQRVYVVTAFDKAGNESAASEPVQERVR